MIMLPSVEPQTQQGDSVHSGSKTFQAAPNLKLGTKVGEVWHQKIRTS